MGISSTSYGSLLCPMILKLLPMEIVIIWHRKDDTQMNSIEDLFDFLKTEIDGRERAAMYESDFGMSKLSITTKTEKRKSSASVLSVS